MRLDAHCPNCEKGKLDISKLKRSIYERRYIYKLACSICGFSYTRKVGMTGAGKFKDSDFSFQELKELRKQGVRI